MIYLFHGSDFEKVRQKEESLRGALLKKRPDAPVFRFKAEDFSQSQFEEVMRSQGLFENKYIVILDRTFENAEAKDFILRSLKELKELPHIFILLEKKIDKASLTRIEKQAEEVRQFSDEAKSKKEKFNIFSLTFAFEYRDKRKLWILYQSARKNAVPEEIHGILWWKLKTMLVSGKNGKYSVPELRKMASELISMYHEAHRGLFEFDLALERFILKV